MNIDSTLRSTHSSVMPQPQNVRHSLGGGRVLQQAAAKLGIDPSKIQDAFAQARSERANGEEFLATVANKLGIQTDTLQQAIQQTYQTQHAGQGAKTHDHRQGGQESSVSSFPTDQSLTDTIINVTA